MTTRTVDVRTVTRRANPRRRPRVHTAVFDDCVQDVRKKGRANPYAVCQAELGERAIRPAHRRRGNPRRARYVDPAAMARRMRRRRETRWRIVGRKSNGVLLVFTGDKLAARGRPVVFPSQALAYKFMRYLRRAFGRHLRAVRLMVLPA